MISVLHIDPRITLTQNHCSLIRESIRERIFELGFNASMQQMPLARSYDPPKGLYRYFTGKLYDSLKVYQNELGTVVMEFAYPKNIMTYLENMYGVIFVWAKMETDFVDKLCSDIAKKLGIPPLGLLSDELILASMDNQTLAIAGQVSALRGGERASELTKRQSEKDAFDKAKTSQPVAPPESSTDENMDNYSKTITSSVTISPNIALTKEDILDIQEYIKTRIRFFGLDSNGSPILDKSRIDYKSINSISLKYVGSNIKMSVVIYDNDIYNKEITITPIYSLGYADNNVISNICKDRMKVLGIDTRLLTIS